MLTHCYTRSSSFEAHFPSSQRRRWERETGFQIVGWATLVQRRTDFSISIMRKVGSKRLPTLHENLRIISRSQRLRWECLP